MNNTVYYPLSVGEIWVDSDGCKWYIYECMTSSRCPYRYYAKCVEGYKLGKLGCYFVSGGSVEGSATLIRKVE